MSPRKSDFGLITLGLMFFALSAVLGSANSGLSERRILVPPPDYIDHMHFGFRYSMSDALWLRWIQDVDTCYEYFGESDVLATPTDLSKKDARFSAPRYKNCDQSWGFQMLDAVTKLDPKFKMPYLAGTMALAVLVEDYKGASVIFDRGLKNYPNDWTLTYRAAYHFLFDEHDLGKAARLLDHAADLGGPQWFKSLAARLYTRNGQLQLGISALEEWRKAYKDPKRRMIVDRRIEKLKAELKKGTDRRSQ